MDALTRHWCEVFDPERMARMQQFQQQLGTSVPFCLHCCHPFVGAWAGSQPPPMHCCWCGIDVPPAQAWVRQHGPYAT